MGRPLRVQGRRPQAPVASWGCVTKHHRGAAQLGLTALGAASLGKGGRGSQIQPQGPSPPTSPGSWCTCVHGPSPHSFSCVTWLQSTFLALVRAPEWPLSPG